MVKKGRKSKRGNKPGNTPVIDMSEAGIAKRMAELAMAVVEDGQMDETRDYVARGRGLAATPDDALKLAWAEAFRNWLDRFDAAAQREMNDRLAELRLRGIEPPYEAAKDELEKLRLEIAKDPDNPGAIKEAERRIREFFDKLNKPKN